MSGVAAGMWRQEADSWRTARRWWGRPLSFHVASFALGLILVAPFLHLDETFTSDEGAYALQVAVLDAGEWEYAYKGGRYDPEGRWFPLVNSSRSERGWYPYVQHPTVPLLLLASTRLFGRVAGLHAPAMIGALGTAVAAWLLAAEIAPSRRRAAFWLAAASPVAVNAYIIWAHAPAAAVGGLAVVAGLRFTRRKRVGNTLVLLLCLVAAALLRSEGLLFALALSVGLVIGSVQQRWRTRAAVALLCVGLVSLVLLAERKWVSAIIGSPYRPQGLRDRSGGEVAPSEASVLDWAAGRVQGAWHSLFQGPWGERRGTTLVVVALALLAFAVYAIRRQRPGWRRDAELALAGAVAVYVLRVVDSPSDSMTGLFAAWPVALLGVSVLPRTVFRRHGVVTVTVAVFTILVLVTQYRIGGGLEWGGRFLSPLTAPLAVMTAIGIELIRQRLPGPRMLPLVGALAVVPLVAGLLVLRTTRDLSGRIIDEVTTGPQLVVTTSPAVPRAAWRVYPAVSWMKVPAAELGEAVTSLRTGGVGEVTVLAPSDVDPQLFHAFPVVRDVTGPVVRSLGARTWRLASG